MTSTTKVTAAIAAQIRTMRAIPHADDATKPANSHPVVGAAFGVSAGTVSQICRNLTFKDAAYTPVFDGHRDLGPRSTTAAKPAKPAKEPKAPKAPKAPKPAKDGAPAAPKLEITADEDKKLKRVAAAIRKITKRGIQIKRHDDASSLTICIGFTDDAEGDACYQAAAKVLGTLMMSGGKYEMAGDTNGTLIGAY